MNSDPVRFDSSASQALWSDRPVGSQRSKAEPGSPAYFEDLRAYRYSYETPFLPSLIRSLEPHGKRVLELGVGHGIDASEFLRLGAEYTGVDVTQRHLDLTAQNLAHQGFSATTTLRRGELVEMFFDRSFDLIYSFGVLHHIPHEEACLNKLQSLCRPGGTAMFAFYARASVFNAYMVATWLAKDRRRHSLTAWKSHLSELSPLDQPVTIRIRGRKELATLLHRTGWRVEAHRRFGFVPGYLPLVGRWVDPRSSLLDGMARLLGWYHVFRCKPEIK